MHSSIQNNDNRQILLLSLLLSAGSVVALFLWQGHKGYDFTDEGFLWYGVQRVMMGEVPIRDFMAYDPGRYYWSAALMSLFSDNGILALRISIALFQFIGLGTAMFLFLRYARKPGVFATLAALLIFQVWSFPNHNIFDICLSIIPVGVLTYLIEAPSSRRYFLTGAMVGVMAFFGRNHGVYAVMGSCGIMVWLELDRYAPRVGPGLLKGFVTWCLGVVVGYLPMLLMVVLIPRFSQAFWNSILFLFQIKGTNLNLPVPWPWTIPFADYSLEEGVRRALVGIFFILMLLVPMAGILWSCLHRFKGRVTSPAVTAAMFMSLPYAHRAFSRADLWHLSQSMFPFFIGLLIMIAKRHSWKGNLLMGVLAVMSLFVILPEHPGWDCLGGRCEEVKAGDDTIMVRTRIAKQIKTLDHVVNLYAKGGAPFLAVPYWPGAYPLFLSRSPNWELCALWPRNPAFEKAELKRIKAAGPAFVLVNEFATDGREDLLYSHTHPRITAYIHENFTPRPDLSEDSNLVFHIKTQEEQ